MAEIDDFNPDDAELAQRFADGDKTIGPTIVRRCCAPIKEFLIRSVGMQDADAEDIVSETIQVAWEKRGSFDINKSLRGWMFGIAKTLATRNLSTHNGRLRYFRNVLSAFPQIAESIQDHSDATNPQTESFYADECLRCLSIVLKELDETEHRILYESIFDPENYSRPLSIEFETTVEAVRKRKQRVVEKVRKKLDELGFPNSREIRRVPK